MEIEHSVKLIPVNDKLMGEVEKLAKEGWTLPAGIEPVAIYHLVRVKPQPATASASIGAGVLSIDESKIAILRDGKLLS